MSNFDLLWTEKQKEAAAEEGWQLALVVNEGRPVSTAYFDIFDNGPQFRNRTEAQRFVMSKAQGRSKLHIAALSAITASRLDAAQAAATQKRRTS